MAEPVWVRDDVVLAVHRRQIAEHGGDEGVRDTGLLESALNRPRHLYHFAVPKPTLAALAARYAHGIARNHPFIDGNKRTALVICRLFLKLNGADLAASQEEKYRTFLALAAGTLTEDDLTRWIAGHLA